MTSSRAGWRSTIIWPLWRAPPKPPRSLRTEAATTADLDRQTHRGVVHVDRGADARAAMRDDGRPWPRSLVRQLLTRRHWHAM
jgi:hypothetical protein